MDVTYLLSMVFFDDVFIKRDKTKAKSQSKYLVVVNDDRLNFNPHVNVLYKM